MAQVLEELKILEDDWKNCIKCPIGKYTQRHMLWVFETLSDKELIRHKETRLQDTECDLMLIVDAPSTADTVLNKPYINPLRKVIRDMLIENMSEGHTLQICFTYLVSCRCFNGKSSSNNPRLPLKVEVDNCHPRLDTLTRLIKPGVIVAFNKTTDLYVEQWALSLPHRPSYGFIPGFMSQDNLHWVKTSTEYKVFSGYLRKMVVAALERKYHGK